MSHSAVQKHASGRTGFALLALGFRPFFLLAGLAAAASVPLWLLAMQGAVSVSSHLAPALWHGHEMVFGFGLAVVAGFLLTATANWTGRRTPAGTGLAALAVLWLAGRILLSAGETVPTWLVVAVDATFAPTLALVLLWPILGTRNHRNLIFPVILLVMGAVNLAFHAAALGLMPLDPSQILRAAVDLIVLMIVIIGGRVIPLFTRNVLPDAGVRTTLPDAPVIGAAALFVAADLVLGSGPVVGVAALAAALANGVRMIGWRGFAARHMPILWILHAGYAWVVVAFALRALAELTGWVPADAALHAFTVGAIGTMTLGMMSRVTLGHTGRRIVAAPPTVVAYALVLAAAFLRVLAPMASGEGYLGLLMFSGMLWTAAFLIFAAVYAPILARPRADGRPG